MRPSIKCSGSSLIYAAFLLLILPVNWVLAASAAAIFHEICHYTAIRLTGNDVIEIFISHGGTIMKTTSLSFVEEIFCALAGPMGSLILLFCYPWIPRIALCAGIQGIFNLIPMYPLDGGRAFHALMCICNPECADVICLCTEFIFIVGIILLTLYFSICYEFGFGPLFLSIILLSRGLAEKSLANRRN